MGTDRETQHRIAVEGTPVLARAARDAGRRAPGAHLDRCRLRPLARGRVTWTRPHRWSATTPTTTPSPSATPTLPWPQVDGITRVLLRPPAILGAGETSIWNTLRPADIRDDENARHAIPRADLRLGPRRRPRRPRRRRGVGRGADVDRSRDRDRSRAGARSSTSRLRPPWPVTTTRRSPGRSASSRSGTTVPPGPAASWPVAPTSGAGPPTVDLDQALAEIDEGLRA